MKKLKQLENLFEQTKDIEFIGARLSGEPEVLHEAQMWCNGGITRDQIKRILEYVPSVFSEDWKSPDSYAGLNEQQKKAYQEIAKEGVFPCPGPLIQQVIEHAVYFRDTYGKMREIILQGIGLNGPIHSPYDDDPQRPHYKDIEETYQRLNTYLAKYGEVIRPQKINPIPIGGVISPASAIALFEFENCLVVNRYFSSVFDGVFHIIQTTPLRGEQNQEAIFTQFKNWLIFWRDHWGKTREQKIIARTHNRKDIADAVYKELSNIDVD